MKKTFILIFSLFFVACTPQLKEERIENNSLEGVLYLNEGAKGGPFLQAGGSSYFLDEEQLKVHLPGYKEMNETLFTITGTTDSRFCNEYEQCLISGMIHRFETIESVSP